jgi:pimeloyl-ACP methyl ester carboxylesterase
MNWLVGAGLAAAAAAAWRLAEGALHVRPERRLQVPASAAEVSTRSSDGLQLRAWYFAGDRVICLLHGFTDSRSGMLDHIRLFRDLGWGVLAPDSRGHGMSEGNLVSFGTREAEDALRWCEWLSQRGVREVAAFGHSMGAAVALLSAARGAPWSKVVAEAGFTRFSQVAAEKIAARLGLSPRWGAWLMTPLAHFGMLYAWARYRINLWRSAPAAVGPRLTVPLLLIHGAHDDSIGVWHSRRLAKLSAHAQYWEIPGAGHTNAIVVAGAEYRQRLAAFLTAPTATGRV